VLFFPRGVWGTLLHELRRRLHRRDPAVARETGETPQAREVAP
jgi:hypothetical protein